MFTAATDGSSLPRRAELEPGAFSAVLTHHRARVFGVCVTYSASVTGSLSFSF
jgi:hypothetical protein